MSLSPGLSEIVVELICSKYKCVINTLLIVDMTCVTIFGVIYVP